MARRTAAASCHRVDVAASRLEAALHASDGVPVSPLSEDDSLATTIEACEEDVAVSRTTSERMIETNRSRRALAQGSGVSQRRRV